MLEREKFTRRNLIIQRLRKSEASFKEITEYLQKQSELQAYKFVISIRTFQRDIEDIRSLFDIEIRYSKSRKAYYIDADSKSETNERLHEAIGIFNALQISDDLTQYVFFEKQKPKGVEHLLGILHAIKNRRQISFKYQKYWDDDISERITEPYAIKEFRNRWYILAKDISDNKIKTFGLDRIDDLDVTKTLYTMPERLNISNYFNDCFGIIRDDDNDIQKVVLSLTPFQAKYIKSLPLHHSQKVILENEKECRISLTLYITYDFTMEILSLGKNVTVLEPQSLIDEIKNKYKQALKNYR